MMTRRERQFAHAQVHAAWMAKWREKVKVDWLMAHATDMKDSQYPETWFDVEADPDAQADLVRMLKKAGLS